MAAAVHTIAVAVDTSLYRALLERAERLQADVHDRGDAWPGRDEYLALCGRAHELAADGALAIDVSQRDGVVRMVPTWEAESLLAELEALLGDVP